MKVLLLFLVLFSFILMSFAETKQEKLVQKIDGHLRNIDLLLSKLNRQKQTPFLHKLKTTKTKKFFKNALEFLDDLKDQK